MQVTPNNMVQRDDWVRDCLLAYKVYHSQSNRVKLAKEYPVWRKIVMILP